MTKLTAEKMETIRGLYEENVKISVIAKSLKINYHTVFRFIERKIRQVPLPAVPRVYTKKLTAFHWRQIEILILENPKLSLNDIIAVLELPCSKEALRRYLKSKDIQSFEIKERIILTDRHKELRRQFCRQMLQKSDDQLNHILFSDEFTVAISRIGGKKTYYARSYRPELDKKKSSFVKKRMFWASISSAAAGPCITIEGTVNAVKYLEIVKDYVEPEIECSEWPDIMFQHDNAPCHKAVLVSNYLLTKSFQVLQWPPYSPDLNPIENCFAIVKSKLEKLKPTEDMEELEDAVLKIWAEEVPQYCKALGESFKRRLQLCLEADGDTIKK